MLYFSDISLIFQLCLYYLAIYTYKAKLKKKKIHIFTAKFLSSTTFLYRKFNTNGFLLMGRYRWFLVGWLVCLWMSSFIYKYLVIRPITIAPLYAYIFRGRTRFARECNTRKTVICNRQTFDVTDVAFLCLSILATLYPLTPQLQPNHPQKVISSL